MKTRTTSLFLLLAFFSGLHVAQAQPTITVQPVSRTNNVGDNAQFTVTATGSGTLSYQWKFNGADIAGSTTGTNNVVVTDSGKAGTYSVVVTDANGPTPSSGAVLSIPFGSRVKITQWNFNSTPPDTSSGTGVTTPSVGSGTMTLSGVAGNNWNDGSLSDPASSDNSGRALQGPSNSTVANKTGGPKFAVSTTGYKDIGVSWELWVAAKASAYWRGQYTTNGTDWVDRVLVDRRSSFAAIGGAYAFYYDDLTGVPFVANNTNFAYRVVGEYQSTATGSGSDAYVPADSTQTYNNTGPFRIDMFTVLGVVDAGADTPVITGQPQSRTNNVGDNAQFSVSASGVGTRTYQWKFAGSAIAGATDSIFNTLITNASQAGNYTVVVTDSVSSRESSNAVLYLPAGNRKMITQWNFNSETTDNDVTTGITTPSTGSGTMTLTNIVWNGWNTGSGSDPASLGTDNSDCALQGPSQTVANKSGGPQFAVDTTWYKNIIVSCEWWVASRASAYWRGQYTTNGTDWIDRMLIDKRTQYTQFGTSTYDFHYDDLSGIEGVENNPNFAYRFVAEWESTATGSGNDAYVMVNPDDPGGFNNTGPFRVDMVSVLGGYLSDTPIITSHPHNAIIPAGANVAFSVSALGDDLAYQWHSDAGAITGATSSSLLLTNVQSAQAGNYWVVVSNPNGSTNSVNAVLTVIDHQIPPGERYWAGGAGMWNTSLADWGLSADGPFDRVWDNANLDSALFVANGAQPGVVTLGEAITVNKLTITNAATMPAYSFTGNSTLTFAGENPEVYVEGDITSRGTNSATISCPVDGAVLTKTGGGRLVFNNTNNTIQKWVVNGGAITSAGDVAAIFGSNQPAQLVTNFVTLNNGGLGFATTSTTAAIGANRGLYLGPGGGQIGNTVASAIITLDSPITGPGGLWFASTGYWPGQAQGANATYIVSNPNNNYGGETLITQCEIRCGTNYVFPVTTTLSISNDAVSGRLNLNGTQQAVDKVLLASRAGSSRIFDSVGGGTLTANEFELSGTAYTGDSVSAVLAGNGVLTKTTTGSISISSTNTYSGDTFHQGGTIQLNGAGRFGNGAGTVYLQGNDGTPTISLNQTRTIATILQNPVVMTAAEAQLQSSAGASGEVVFLCGGSWDVESGNLYLVNTSTNAGSAFTLALTSAANFAAAAQVWLWSDTVWLSSLNPAGTDQVFDSPITGAGGFRRPVLAGAGGRTIFTAANSYSGATLIEAGTLLVNNAFGSGTGSGAVTVGAPSGVLGGSGIVGGPVTVNSGGSIAAGSSAGVLTLQNGLDMSAGGTNIWELVALKDSSDGVAGSDFDQLALSGGELQLGGSSSLVLQFAEGLTPTSVAPFWQAAHSWTIVSLGGRQNTANATFASIVNGSYNAGNFATSVDGGGNIVLTFTPNAPSEPHVTANPQSRTNVVGTTAAFTVAATGSDPLTYKWYRNGAPPTQVSGQTNATCTLLNVQPSQAGDYFAVVFNGLGSATSQAASLTVVPRPNMQPPAGDGLGGVVLTWPTIPETSYQVQYNTNLATSGWYPVTNIVAAGWTISITERPPAGGNQRFYRLLIQ